jgi:hypothetical protein
MIDSSQFKSENSAEGQAIPIQIKKDAIRYHNVVFFVKLNECILLVQLRGVIGRKNYNP